MDFLKELGIEEKNYGSSTGQKWNESTDQGELKIHSPATGEYLATVYQASQADYDQVVKTAENAFLYWRKKFSEKKPTHSTFVEVPSFPTNRFGLIRIEIGHRYCVEVDKSYDPATLEHIIGFLSRT